MSQIIEITASQALTSPTAYASLSGLDEIAANASTVEESEVRDGLYRLTFSGLAVGEYRVVLRDSGGLVAVRYLAIDAAEGLWPESEAHPITADAVAEGILAGLSSDRITRIGPDFNPVTKAITLIAGDDYLQENDSALTFDLHLPGFDLVGATAVFAGWRKGFTTLMGTATLLDVETETPKLRLEWTHVQTLLPHNDRYCWGVKILKAGLQKTIIGGPLILKRPLVDPAVVAAALGS